MIKVFVLILFCLFFCGFKNGCLSDFIFCNNSLHNILNINETIVSLKEISRVGKSAWVSIAAYVTEEEKERIDSWAVVATTYMSQSNWLRLFDASGYDYDYYWFKP